MSLIVVDASVFNKLFLDEPDRDLALGFFRHVLAEAIPFGAPELLKLEACQCALHYDQPFSNALALLERYTAGGFEWINLTDAHWIKAEELARTGNPKAGYPTLIDSLYHAAAILAGGTFLTSDRRHLAKAAGFGHVTLLADWRPEHAV